MTFDDDVQCLLASQARHTVRSALWPDGNGSHLSAFECSCGQKFFPSDVAPRVDDAPSMVSVHIATMNLLDAGASLEDAQVLRRSQEADALGLGSVVQTGRGAMARKVAPDRWHVQSGVLKPSTSISFPAVVLWAPR